MAGFICDVPGKVDVSRKGPTMILLPGGRYTNELESSFEVDAMADFAQAPSWGRRQRLTPWRPAIDVFEAGGGRADGGTLQRWLSGTLSAVRAA